MPRFIMRPAALAGFQMKMEGYETWGCDGCWEEFKNEIKDRK